MPTRRRREPATVERWAQALELRKAGATYAQIAAQLGWASSAGAWDAVQRALKETLQEPADDLRKLELERLDRWMLAMSRRLQAGEPRAVEVALKLQERRSRLLGLDAPEKRETTGKAEITLLDLLAE